MAAGFKKATVNAASVPSTQASFPSYVDLSRLGITTLAEAQSVRCYSDAAKTTELARDIVSLAEMHVKVTSLTSTFVLYVDWDGVRADYAVTDTYGRNAVWSDYYAVWHLQGAVGASKREDATGNARNWTDNVTPTAIADNFTASNGGYDMDGLLSGNTSSTTLYDWLSQTTRQGALGGNPYTLQVMFYPDALPTSAQTLRLIGEEENDATGRKSFYIDIVNTGAVFLRASVDLSTSVDLTTAASAYAASQWNWFVHRREVTTNLLTATVNGTRTAGTAITGSFTAGNNTFNINRRHNPTYSSAYRYADGKYGEARLRLSDVGTDWCTTEYNNQSAESTFWGTWSDVASSFIPRASFVV